MISIPCATDLSDLRMPLVLGVIAASLTLCSGCISAIAALGCAAAQGNCSDDVVGNAFQADMAIANAVIEGSQRDDPSYGQPADDTAPNLAEPLEEIIPPPPPGETVVPPPLETVVDVSVIGAERERVEVFEYGKLRRGRGVVAACGPPCTLSLPPSDYVFSVGGYSTSAIVTIPEVSRRTLELEVTARDELRIWGWSLVGGGIVGMAGLTAAVVALELNDPVLILPTMLVNGLAVIVGVLLGVLPDELAVGASF